MNKVFFILFFIIGVNIVNAQDVNYENPQEYEISNITVHGSENFDKESLIAISGLRVGDVIMVPGLKISEAIKKLWKQGFLGDVQIRPVSMKDGKIHLGIYVTELPRVSRIVFKGIPKSQREALEDRVNVVRGMRMTKAIHKNIKINIRKYYEEKALNRAEITINQRKDPTLTNSVILEVGIDPKKKVKIDAIELHGVKAFKHKKVKRKLKKTKERKLWRILSPSKFVKDEYEADKEKVIAFYNKHGYRNAIITEDSVIDQETGNVTIKLYVHEDKIFYYRNITWKGNYIYDDKKLSKILAIEKGDVYNEEELQKRLNGNPNGLDITTLYMDNGYLFFRVVPTEIRVDGDFIDIEMRIFEGEQATINKIIINGNTKTTDKVIRRELMIYPGDKFSRSAIIRTNQRLAQLGYFNPQTIGINPIPNFANGTVDIEFDLEEKSNDQLELSGGWGGSIGFIGTLGVRFSNFSLRNLPNLRAWRPLPGGDGQVLALRFQANGRFFQNYSLSFSEPWLGGNKPISFSTNISHAISRRTNGFSTDVIGGLQITSASVGLGKRLKWPDDYFNVNASINYTKYNLDNFTGFFGGFSTGVTNNLTLNLNLGRYSSGTDPNYPTYGSEISLAAKFTPPFSALGDGLVSRSDLDEFKWIEYHKWMFDNRFYLNLAKDKLVLNARMHFGFMGRYGKSVSQPPFERFLLGGDGLTMNTFAQGNDIIGLRGYENQSIVPNIQGEDIGGVAFAKYVLELRYPLSLNPMATIYVHSFMEAGNNWASLQQFDPFNLKKSVGFGARVFMPAFGLLGVDYGWGLDDIAGKPGVNGGQFHFTIGRQLR